MFDEILESIKVPEPDKKYLGEDGFMH